MIFPAQAHQIDSSLTRQVVEFQSPHRGDGECGPPPGPPPLVPQP